MRLFYSFVLLVGLIGYFPTNVRADLISLVNPGFEDISGENQVNEFTFGPFIGWELYDPLNITSGGAGSTYFIGTLTPTPPTFFTNSPPEGNRVAIAFNFEGSGGQGEYGLQQTLAATLQANSRYTVDVAIGNIASGNSQNGTFFNLAGFPGYRIDLLAGDELLAQDNNSLAGLIPEGAFLNSSFSFTSGAAHSQLGQNLRIRLVNLNQIDPTAPNADLEVDFDDVRINVTAIPEPNGMLLSGLGMALAFNRRRRAA